jgi:hypothetical protein
MKKATWLQLIEAQIPIAATTALDVLTRYKKRHSAPARSPARVQQERRYRSRVQEWLRLAENRWCRVYLLLTGQRVPATQCHHYQGRRGMLLLYEPFWIPVSWEGHRWIDDHREQARQLGRLCPLGRFNSPVKTIGNAPEWPGISRNFCGNAVTTQ